MCIRDRTVADIDFKNEVVIIDHQLLKSKEQGYYIETPKTKSGTRDVYKSQDNRFRFLYHALSEL